MNNEKRSHIVDPQDEGDNKWGLIVLLVFLLGIPLLGILAKLLGY